MHWKFPAPSSHPDCTRPYSVLRIHQLNIVLNLVHPIWQAIDINAVHSRNLISV